MTREEERKGLARPGGQVKERWSVRFADRFGSMRGPQVPDLVSSAQASLSHPFKQPFVPPASVHTRLLLSSPRTLLRRDPPLFYPPFPHPTFLQICPRPCPPSIRSPAVQFNVCCVHTDRITRCGMTRNAERANYTCPGAPRRRTDAC